MSFSPEVCIDRHQATVYVATTDGRLQAVSTTEGELIAELVVQGLPVTAADGLVIVVDRPGEHSLGSVACVEQHVSDGEPTRFDLAIRWTAPLLDPAEFEQVRHELAEGDLSAEIGRAEIGVVGRFRLRYQGGVEPPMDVVGRGSSEYVVTASYDRATGRRHTGTPSDVHPVPNGDGPTSAASQPRLLPVDPVAGEWAVQQPEGGSRTVLLDPGTDAAEVVEDRVLYRVVERATDGSGTRRYLRSRPIDPEQGPGWSHLMEQSTTDPPPSLRP